MKATYARPPGRTFGLRRGLILLVPPMAGLFLSALLVLADNPARYIDYDEPPRPLEMTRPNYPSEAFSKKVEGTVEIEFVVDETGRPTDLRVVKSIPGLDEAALACVKKWRFKPAQKEGKPVKSTALAPVTFRITKKDEPEATVLPEVAVQPELERLSRAWTDAWLAKDAAVIEALMAPEYTYIGPNGRIQDRERILAVVRSPTYRLDRTTRSEVRIVRFKDSAVILSRSQSAGSYEGQAFTEDHRCSSVWVLREGTWRLAWEHSSAIAP